MHSYTIGTTPKCIYCLAACCSYVIIIIHYIVMLSSWNTALPLLLYSCSFALCLASLSSLCAAVSECWDCAGRSLL